MAVTSLAGYSAALVDRLDFARASAVAFNVTSEAGVFGRRFPRRHAPDGAGERFQLQRLLAPLAAWLASAIERTKTSIDSAGIGLGS